MAPQISVIGMSLHLKLPRRYAPVKKGVKGQSKGVIEHPGNQTFQQLTRLIQARVGVDFYQPGMAVLVDHEIISEDLEAVFPIHGIQQLLGSFQTNLNVFMYGLDAFFII